MKTNLRKAMSLFIAIVMLVTLFPATMTVSAKVSADEQPSNPVPNLFIGILDDNRVDGADEFPNEPSVTGYTYYYLKYKNRNYSLDDWSWDSRFTDNAGSYININAFWNDGRIVKDNSGDAFGYYDPTGLDLTKDSFFVTGFGATFPEDDIIRLWMSREGITENVSDYDLLFYVLKYEKGFSAGYHLDAKVVKKNNVVLSYNANKPAGVNADIILPASHSVEPNTNITVEDLGSAYKKQTANGLDYRFVGWNTKADRSGTAYTAGSQISVTENTVLYAQWDVTNKYQVTWVNYNDTVLYSTGHTVSYGDPLPAYSGETPTQPNDATHKYTFAEKWDLIEGTYNEETGVTQDLVYKAVYTAEPISHKATVAVVLNGTFDQDGNRSSSNPGDLIDIDVVDDVDENVLYIKKIGENDYIKLEKDSEGVYSNAAVGNGSYLIYRKDNDEYIQIGTQALTINNADRIRYLPYYNVIYYNDTEVFHEEYYYIGSEVDVISDVPTKDDYVFTGWKDDENNDYNSSTSFLTVDITDSIIKHYELTAQWDDAAKVDVTVVVDHNSRELHEVDEDLTIRLTVKNEGTENYNEVWDTARTFDDWFDGESETTYEAGELYTNLSPYNLYGAHAVIPGYRSDTGREGGAIEIVENNGVYEVTIYLIYDPVGYELPFTVNIDPETPERMIPKAVDVKVTRWDGTSWEPIPQHENQSVEVVIPDGELSGTGKVHVWGFDADNANEPYLYRIDVVRIDLGDYQLTVSDTDNVNYSSAVFSFFPASAYTAVVEVTEDSDQSAGGLRGAHANSNYEHHGEIYATIEVHPYNIKLDTNGGAWEDQSTDAKTIENRFTIPDLAEYNPTREGYTFAGWVKKGTSTGVKASDAILDYGIDVGETLELEAVWNENLTVKGDVVVDLGYPCDDDSRKVLVLLQRREGEGTYYVSAAEKEITLEYQDGTNYAKGSYSFTNVPNLDTYHYRINVVVAGGGEVYYQNEPESTSVENNIYIRENYNKDMYEAVFGDDLEAVVNVYMEAIPFKLGYMADTSAISEDFRPENLTLDLWHDHTVNGVEEFHQIIPQMYFEAFDGDGISAIKTVDVPPYHANGQLYDYAISVLQYSIPAMSLGVPEPRHYYHYTETEGYAPAPFSIRYTGPAEYNEAGIEVDGITYKQDVILKAIFEPNSYAIAYELNDGSWAEGTVVHTHHKWSESTIIPTPVKAGYIFDGWDVVPAVTTDQPNEVYVEDGEGNRIVPATWTDVTFTANWKKDEWTDGNPDAQDLGDEVADEEQVRIIYVSSNTAFGVIQDNKELDIVTLDSDTVTAAAIATPVDENHEFVSWTCEEISFTTDNPELNHSFVATGGETYVFVAEFKAIDDWNAEENKDDEPDQIPDLEQVKVTYRSDNLIGGEVSKALEIFNISENPVIAAAEATANPGYEFVGWRCEKISFTTDNPELNHSFVATGGEAYEFVAEFAPIDEWNADDNTDTPDGIYDMYQIKVNFESADISMGYVAPEVDIITIPGEVSHGTVTALSTATANSGYQFVKWTHETVEVGTAAALNYEFDATGGSEYTFIADFKVSSGGGGGGGTTRYTLTYETNGGNNIAKETYTSGRTVELTKVPKKDGYVFEGWYLDKELTEAVSEVKMNKNITVYAAWVEDNGSAGNGYDTPGSLNGEDHFAYVVGYPDGTVRPNDNISRAEVTSIFFRLLKPDELREQNLTSNNDFTDVNSTDWYNTAISTMAKLGIVKGRTANEFIPNAFITRAEFAAICARFDDSEFEVVDNFADVKGHWAEDEIHEAAAHGWIRGYTEDTFKPDQFITRAEAMTMINRVLNRVPETKADLLDDMIKWPDNSDETAWYYLSVQEATNSHEYDMKNHIYERWTAIREASDWEKYE